MIKKTNLLLLCLAALVFNNCKNIDKAPESPEDIGSVMIELEKDGFSGSVLVAKEWEIQHSAGMGYANREAEIPATSETLYDLGSITKGFTKVAILKLAESGKLSLDAPISVYLENVPAEKKEITLRQLLYHTSGLGEYHDTEGDFENMTKEQALAAIFSQSLKFEPGTKISYSNSGYTLLAAIIEEVTNQTYINYLKQEILQPCDLQKTGFYQSTTWKPEEVAIGYGAKTVGETNSPHYWPKPEWALMGNGGLVSSTEEYYKWLECLHNGKIISKEMVREHMELNSMIAGSNDFGFNAISYRRGDGQTLVAFSNANNDIVEVIKRLLSVVNEQDQNLEVPALEKAVAARTHSLHKALQTNNKKVLLDFVQENFSSNLLKQVRGTAFAEGLAGVSSHLGEDVIMGELLKLDRSLYQIKFKANNSDNMASVMLLLESETPFKIKGFSPSTGIDMDSEETVVSKAANARWGLPADNDLASVYNSMFSAFEKGTDEALTDFVKRNMGEDFRNDFPMDTHLKFLRGMRQSLGKDFKIEEIRQKGKGELHLLVRAADGKLYQMKAEADPKAPQKLGSFLMSKK